MRRRWLEMDRARLELYRQNEYLRAEIRKLRNEIIDVDGQRQDMQLKVLDHDRIRSEEREEDQRIIRKASGLLDRILVELEILTGFFIYTTPRGECWHSSDRCTHLQILRECDVEEAALVVIMISCHPGPDIQTQEPHSLKIVQLSFSNMDVGTICRQS